jgi:hypothetical protein
MPLLVSPTAKQGIRHQTIGSMMQVSWNRSSSLGITLVTKTRRAVTLTEAGTNYLARIEPIPSILEEANYGTVRVGVASATASRIIVPRSHRFMRTHPKLHLELQASRSAKRHLHGTSTSGESSTIKSDGKLLKRHSDDDQLETTHTFPRRLPTKFQMSTRWVAPCRNTSIPRWHDRRNAPHARRLRTSRS